MEFSEIIYGESSLKNPLKAYCSPNFYNDKFFYCMAGIHGDKIEGINVVENLLKWLRESEKSTFPCVLIPVLDIDGFLYQDTEFPKSRNLNHLFPASSYRSGKSDDKEVAIKKIPAEIVALTNLFLRYPPQLCLNLRTAKKSAKVIGVGDDAQSIAGFLAKTTNYPLITDNNPAPHTLEAFIYDFFLCSVVTIRLPFFTEKKTVMDIYKECHKGIEQLLSGQVY